MTETNPEGPAGKLTRKAVATYTLSWSLSSQNKGKIFPSSSFQFLSLPGSQPSLAHSCAADVWPALFSYSSGLSGQAARHSSCSCTPHCVLHWDRGNSPSAGSSEQVHHDAYTELGTTWVPLLHPSPLISFLLLRHWVWDTPRCSGLQEEKLEIPPAGPAPSDCLHKALGKQPAQQSWWKNIQTRANCGNEAPQTVHVAGMQTLLLHRSTKKPTKKARYRTHADRVLGKLSGWSLPHFQAYIQDPDLSPKMISQLFSGTHAFHCCANRAQCSKTCSTSLYNPNTFPDWALTFFVVQTGGIMLWFPFTEMFSRDKLFSSLWKALLLSLKEGNP